MPSKSPVCGPADLVDSSVLFRQSVTRKLLAHQRTVRELHRTGCAGGVCGHARAQDVRGPRLRGASPTDCPVTPRWLLLAVLAQSWFDLARPGAGCLRSQAAGRSQETLGLDLQVRMWVWVWD